MAWIHATVTSGGVWISGDCPVQSSPVQSSHGNDLFTVRPAGPSQHDHVDLYRSQPVQLRPIMMDGRYRYAAGSVAGALLRPDLPGRRRALVCPGRSRASMRPSSVACHRDGTGAVKNSRPANGGVDIADTGNFCQSTADRRQRHAEKRSRGMTARVET
jgi:hypothetical protein